jgi:hypothetical protein
MVKNRKVRQMNPQKTKITNMEKEKTGKLGLRVLCRILTAVPRETNQRCDSSQSASAILNFLSVFAQWPRAISDIG